VRVTFDERAVSYASLLDVFWAAHDPCAKKSNGKYRSVIFAHCERHVRLAEASVAAARWRLGDAVLTVVVNLTPPTIPTTLSQVVASTKHVVSSTVHAPRDHKLGCESLGIDKTSVSIPTPTTPPPGTRSLMPTPPPTLQPTHGSCSGDDPAAMHVVRWWPADQKDQMYWAKNPGKTLIPKPQTINHRP
jgi:hypothetical protein